MNTASPRIGRSKRESAAEFGLLFTVAPIVMLVCSLDLHRDRANTVVALTLLHVVPIAVCYAVAWLHWNRLFIRRSSNHVRRRSFGAFVGALAGFTSFLLGSVSFSVTGLLAGGGLSALPSASESANAVFSLPLFITVASLWYLPGWVVFCVGFGALVGGLLASEQGPSGTRDPRGRDS